LLPQNFVPCGATFSPGTQDLPHSSQSYGAGIGLLDGFHPLRLAFSTRFLHRTEQ